MERDGTPGAVSGPWSRSWRSDRAPAGHAGFVGICGKGCCMSLSAAKSRLGFARENLESGRTDGLASMLDDAERFLAGEPDEEAAPYRAEIAAIRAEFAALPT